MKRLLWITIPMVLVCTVAGYAVFASQTAADTPKHISIDRSQTEVDNKFAFKLFAEMIKTSGNRNVVISGPSVLFCLSMAANGAVGDTQTAIIKGLQLDSMDQQQLNATNSSIINYLNNQGPDVELSVANSLWVNSRFDLKADYTKSTKSSYNAEIDTADFSSGATVYRINDWVRAKTRGRIDKLTDDLDPDMPVVLLNAVYFKGKWVKPLTMKYRVPLTFTLPDGSKIAVDPIGDRDEFNYQETRDFQAIILPYKGEKQNMIVFLPSRELGLKGFLEKLNDKNWQTWMSGFSLRDGSLKMPRFTTEYSEELRPALTALGMGIAFDPVKANFSKMTSTKAWIGQVLHKTYLKVDEEGSEAAAITGTGMITGAPPAQRQPFEMTVDRPFFCAIMDNNTGLLLFMGAINNPSD